MTIFGRREGKSSQIVSDASKGTNLIFCYMLFSPSLLLTATWLVPVTHQDCTLEFNTTNSPSAQEWKRAAYCSIAKARKDEGEEKEANRHRGIYQTTKTDNHTLCNKIKSLQYI
jgi:hypothetical protein